MREFTLEQEFEIYKQMHKTTMVTAKLTTLYSDLQNTGITIPSFMQEKPEKRAEREVINLIGYNAQKFEDLYNQAWNEYAEVLP